MLVKHSDSQYVHFSFLGLQKKKKKKKTIPTYQPIFIRHLGCYSKQTDFFILPQNNV